MWKKLPKEFDEEYSKLWPLEGGELESFISNWKYRQELAEKMNEPHNIKRAKKVLKFIGQANSQNLQMRTSVPLTKGVLINTKSKKWIYI